MSAVAEQTVWQDLLAEGASSIQAAGIMGNMFYESSFNPEAIGDQGTSFGVVQQHGSQYARLVTGNNQADLTAQLQNIRGDIGLASGSTASAAGSAFSANFEKCVGCQVGGSQNTQRSAEAQTIFNAAQSGNWPQQSTGAAAIGSSGSSSGCSYGLNPISDINCAASQTVSAIGNALNPVNWLQSAFGVSFKEIAMRLGLVVMGAIIVIVGIVVLVKASNVAEVGAMVAAPEAAPAIAAGASAEQLSAITN